METAVHIAHVIHNLAKGHSIIVTLDVLLSFTFTSHFKSTTYISIIIMFTYWIIWRNIENIQIEGNSAHKACPPLIN